MSVNFKNILPRKAIHNLSVDHLDEYLATYLLSTRKSDDDINEPVTLRSIVGSIDGNFKEQSTHTSRFSLTRDCLKAKHTI
ncbi:hypothetical protein DPMN_000596 [Dreissena polymorpha]|uniref:Uncharacterized protein n=1 Tax=Dreissena polymorpha TaxID=45954 RepID=A0A9D4MJV9_DREPO|nr:hypothetical protein DPMN_000596 [Dreissena polymorpha]